MQVTFCGFAAVLWERVPLLAVELGLLGPDIASRLQALCPKLVPFGDDIFPALRPLAVQQE